MLPGRAGQATLNAVNHMIRTTVWILLAAAAGSAAAADWPQWRGPRRNGHTAEALPPGPWTDKTFLLAWEREVGTGFSGVTVVGNHAYTMGNRDDRDTIWCLDTRTGEAVWRHDYACELGPKYYEGGPGATPTVDHGLVYTISKWGDVRCLEADTGRVRWQRDLRREPGLRPNEWGYAGSALVVGETVFFNASEAGLALDRRTGQIQWFHGHGSAGYASPLRATLDGTDTVLVFAAKRLVGLAPETGRELWSYPWRTGYDNNNADPVVTGNMVFITSYDRGCALLEVRSGDATARYTSKALQTHMAPPVLVDGFLYGFSRHYRRRPELRCVELATGRVCWVRGPVAAGSVLAQGDGTLLVLFGDGSLERIAADPEACRTSGRVQALSGRCWTPPTLAHGRLYLRNAQGRLRCLRVGLPSRGD